MRFLSVVKYKGRSKKIDKDTEYVVVGGPTRDPELRTSRLTWYHGSRMDRVTILPRPMGYTEMVGRSQYQEWRDGRGRDFLWFRETFIYQLMYRYDEAYTVAASSLIPCGNSILEQIMYKTLTYEAQKTA